MDQTEQEGEKSKDTGIDAQSVTPPRPRNDWTGWREAVDANRGRGERSEVSVQEPSLWALNGRMDAMNRIGTR